MNTGRLDQRVTIERIDLTQTDEIGQPIEAWFPVFACWASIEPMTGREYIAAMAAQAERTVRITIRCQTGIVPAMRVRFMDRIFDIESVINPREGNRLLHLMCQERS